MGNSQGKEASTAAKLPSYEENPYVQRILEARQKLTGWERVKLIFKGSDEIDDVSPELQRIIHTCMISLVVGGLIGAIGRGRIAHMNFLRSNAHEIFETPLQAKRKLQDSVTLGMFSGGWRIGWRVAFFTTTYMSISTVISTYRGKMGILDQVVGAGAAGFLYKFPQGPKAQVAGTLVGSMLGLSAGIITAGLTKLTGETIDSANLRYYYHLAKKEQENVKAEKASIEFLRKIEHQTNYKTKEFDDLTKFHEELIASLDGDKNSSLKTSQVKMDEDQQKSSSSQTTSNNVENNDSQVGMKNAESDKLKMISEMQASKITSSSSIPTEAVKR